MVIYELLLIISLRDENFILFLAISWVLMMSGYYNSNIGFVTCACIYIETNGAQFELLIRHSKNMRLFVRAIDMLKLSFILSLLVSKTTLYFDNIQYIVLFILKFQVVDVTLILKTLYNLSWVYSLNGIGE